MQKHISIAILLTIIAISSYSILSRIENNLIVSSVSPRSQTATVGDISTGLITHYTFDDGTAKDLVGSKDGVFNFELRDSFLGTTFLGYGFFEA